MLTVGDLSNESYTTDDATSFQYLTLAERERERKGSEGERERDNKQGYGALFKKFNYLPLEKKFI